VLLLGALIVDVVLGDAPMDCGTFAGFRRIFDDAAVVVKATPLETATAYCNTNLSQFTAQGVVRDASAGGTLAAGQTFKVFATSDTPGLFPVRTDQGSVLLMLFAPSSFDRSEEDCGPYPDNTFSLQDCGGPTPLQDLSPDELGILGELTCGNSNSPCMNKDNWNDCRRLLDGGCNSIIVMESCPVQFACSDTCCDETPECGAGLFKSEVPCCPREEGCSVVSTCCTAVYCRQSTGTTCDSPTSDSDATPSVDTAVASLLLLFVVAQMG